MPLEQPAFPPVSPKATVLFCLRFAAVYLTFSFVWPLVRPAYEKVFCEIAEMAYRIPSGMWEVEFDRTSGAAPPNRLRAVVVNPERMNRDGSGPVRNLDIDIEAFGWRPIALISALAISIAFPPERRLFSWISAILVLQTLAIAILGLILWADSKDIGFNSGPVVESASRGVALKLLPTGTPVLVWLISVLFFTRKAKK